MLRALLCAFIVLAGRGGFAAEAKPAPYVLDVRLLQDPDFPKIDAHQADVILRYAKAMLADKLGFVELRFNMVGEESVAHFLDRNAPLGSACLKEFEPVRVRPQGRRAIDVDHDAVVSFLSRWDLASLQGYFPESMRPELTSYNVVADKLLAELDRKVTMISGFTLPSGKRLIDRDSLERRSYVRWVCAMRAQNEADLFLTNAFVLYDLASEPYPHTVFQRAKVGGASLASPARHALGGR